MPIIYSLVARGETVLAEHSSVRVSTPLPPPPSLSHLNPKLFTDLGTSRLAATSFRCLAPC